MSNLCFTDIRFLVFAQYLAEKACKIKLKEALLKVEIENQSIDNGKGFDWGRISEDYVRFRLYPFINNPIFLVI